MILLSDRQGVVAGTLLAIALLSVPARIVFQARGELASAEAALASNDDIRAVDHFRRTLRWSLPLFNHEDEAIAGLERIARSREVAGDRAGALLAWRSLLGGLESTRSLYGVADPAVKRAKNEIARLAVAKGEADRYRTLLDRDVTPDALGATLLLFGFSMWLASLILLIGKGFDEVGRLRLRAARAPVLGAIAGFASFVIGLVFA